MGEVKHLLAISHRDSCLCFESICEDIFSVANHMYLHNGWLEAGALLRDFCLKPVRRLIRNLPERIDTLYQRR